MNPRKPNDFPIARGVSPPPRPYHRRPVPLRRRRSRGATDTVIENRSVIIFRPAVRRRRWIIEAAAVVALAGLCMAAGWWLFHDRGEVNRKSVVIAREGEVDAPAVSAKQEPRASRAAGRRRETQQAIARRRPPRKPDRETRRSIISADRSRRPAYDSDLPERHPPHPASQMRPSATATATNSRAASTCGRCGRSKKAATLARRSTASSRRRARCGRASRAAKCRRARPQS